MEGIRNFFVNQEFSKLHYTYVLCRTVSYSQGAALAAEFKIPFIECSSKTGENIGEAFSLLLSEVEKENPSEPVDTFAQPDCIIA